MTNSEKIAHYSKNRDRYYNGGPDTKSLDDCRRHGRDHKAYRWTAQIDPRWSDEQKIAYIDGYENYRD